MSRFAALTTGFVAVTLATGFAFADAALEARIDDLEARMARLEATLDVPAPPPTSLDVDGFSFTRFDYRDNAIGFEIVGEVAHLEEVGDVLFRFTLYDADGGIVETDTTLVEGVGTTPRTFGTSLFSDATMRDVDGIGIQVEDVY